MKLEKNPPLIAIFCFLLVRALLINPTYSDENIYFNMAGNMVSAGIVPYLDFVYPHPPLQIYLLSLVFSLFGKSLLLGKMIPLVFICLSSLLLPAICKGLAKEKRYAPAALFLLIPQVIALGSIEYGMWSGLFFAMLSLYLLFRRKTALSALSLLISVFFRYLFLLYVPILLFFSQKEKVHWKFLICFSLFGLIFLSTAFIAFGSNFLDQTILYHLRSKLGNYTSSTIFSHFLTMNLPFIFVVLMLYFITRKKILFLPVFLDILVLLIFRIGFAHYFFLSLPFYSVFIPVYSKKINFPELPWVFISIFLLVNIPTIVYYHSQNPVLSELLVFMQGRDGTIWGESIVTNLVSFVNGNPVSGNEFDADPIRIWNEPGLAEKVFLDPPEYLLLTSNMPGNLFQKYMTSYSLSLEINGTPYIFVFHKI